MKTKLKKVIKWDQGDTEEFGSLKKLLSWDIDIALRYHPVISFINKKDGLNILEVGSSSRGLANYTDRYVTGVDLCFEGVQLNNLKQVCASSSELPFKDKEFDMVVCMDVLEHIEEKERLGAMLEMFRVSGRYLVVGAPCGDKALSLDRVYNKKFEKICGVKHGYITEHIKYGLPDIDKYLDLVKGYNFKVVKVMDNVPLSLWKFVNLNFMRRGVFTNLFFKSVFPFVKGLKGKDYYRKIYFIEIG
ncbi:MAG: class I SAM-dependent methyltransferase [Armatimonadota bacterium]